MEKRTFLRGLEKFDVCKSKKETRSSSQLKIDQRPDTLKALGENMGKSFQDISIAKSFLNRTPKTQATTLSIDKRVPRNDKD